MGKEEHVLVYEYMGRGNMARALYMGNLTWHERVRIAVDVTEELVYLHDLIEGAVVHGDVKPPNGCVASESVGFCGVKSDAIGGKPCVDGVERDDGVHGPR